MEILLFVIALALLGAERHVKYPRDPYVREISSEKKLDKRP